MDTAISAIFVSQFLILCLGIAAITFVFRKFAEFLLSCIKKPSAFLLKLWQELILPIMPILIGGAVGHGLSIVDFTPNGIKTTFGKILFGLVAGMFSGLVYKVTRGMLKDKVSKEISDRLPGNLPDVGDRITDPTAEAQDGYN